MPDIKKPKNRLDELENTLYRRGEKLPEAERSGFSYKTEEVDNKWGRTERVEGVDMKKRKFPKMIILLFVAIAFFVLSIMYAFFSIGTGRNIISSDNIDISVKGPVSIKGGEELTLQIVVANKNAVPLEFVDLGIVYPKGTRSSNDLSKEFLRYRKSLDTIKSGEIVRETSKAVIFGEENEEKTIAISLEYRTPGSNAIFEVEKEYTLIVTSAPIAVTLSIPDETNSGQDIEIEAQVHSNSTEVIENVHLEIEYPTGFSFGTASPKPSIGSDIWSLGDLTPGTSRTINIAGTIEGDENEAKGFRAIAGLLDENGNERISIPYASLFESMIVKKPFVDLALSLNGDTSFDFITNPGSQLRADVTWQNRLQTALSDAELTVEFQGNVLDAPSIFLTNGFYRSSDQTIIWRSQDAENLSSIAPGDSGKVNFSFKTIPVIDIVDRGYVDPNIKIITTLKGTRPIPGRTDEEVLIQDEKTVRLNSSLSVDAGAFYQSGSFTNAGPVPPRVDQETTYTLTWTVSDTSNDAENVTARAILPTYVRWLNLATQGENITYDSNSGQVVWDLGTVYAGTGNARPARQVSFQVAFTPGLGQINQTPELVSDIQITGRDVFTGSLLTDKAVSLDTVLEEPGFTRQQGVVTQ